MIAAIERFYGLREGTHFGWGRPPKSVPKCIIRPKSYDNYMWFANGALVAAASLATIGSVNGMTLNFIIGDECKFLPKKKIDEEVMPALSGIVHPLGDERFSDANPFYKSTFFCSDASLTTRGNWLAKEEDRLDTRIDAGPMEGRTFREVQQELEDYARKVMQYNELLRDAKRAGKPVTTVSAATKERILALAEAVKRREGGYRVIPPQWREINDRTCKTLVAYRLISPEDAELLSGYRFLITHEEQMEMMAMRGSKKYQRHINDLRCNAFQFVRASSLDNIDTGRAAMPLPFMTAVEILTRLGTQAGVTIDTTPFAGLALPLQTRTANAEAIAAQGYILRRGQTYRAITTNSIQQTLRLYGIKYNSLTYDSDLQGIADGELLDIDGIDKLRITVDKGTEYVMRMSLSDYNNSVIRSLSGVSLWACDEDGESCKRIAFLTGCTVTSYTSGGNYFQRVTYERKVKVDVDVSQYSYLRIGVGQAGTLGDYAQGYYLNAGRIAIATNPDTDTEVVVGGKLPLWLNLPDWTGGQLLKNLMKMQGLFPVCPNGAAIDFISVAELYTNRPDALDWTARLDWEGGQPDERTSALQGYAQHNHFRYTPDESVAGDYDGVLEIYDSTLESDGDLVTLDFAATDGGDRPRIPAWELDDSSQWQFIGGNYGQRILRLNDGAYTFKGLSWPELLNAYYRDYAVIVAQPRVVKARVVVDAAELATLDLSRPVYSYGAGRYFALTKLTTNGAGRAPGACCPK